MQPSLTRKLKTLGLISLFACFAGIIYQLINEKRVDHQSIMFGLPLGIIFGLIELFLLPKAVFLRRWSFTKVLIAKTVFYAIVINTVIIAIILISGLIDGEQLVDLVKHLQSIEHIVVVIFSLVTYALLVFFIQINHLLGEGVLWKFITGKYHKPREEERIFMFLDMKSSTTIAEQLGHVRFYTLLNELFHEISKPVLQTKAEIYQYVGDEVILTWEIRNGLENSNCLNAFFLFKENLDRNTDNYKRNFGVRPEFKAGLHFGKVITAQIGDLKREIVYNGDVLNTTSRITSECNKYQRDCLVSGSLMRELKTKDFTWERLNTVTLRGKETEVELYSVRVKNDVENPVELAY